MGKASNKGLKHDDKKEGLLKRLKNIENKTEKQSKLIKDKQSKQSDKESVINIFDEQLPQKVRDMLMKLINQEKSINYRRLNFKRDKNLEFDFKDYKNLREFFKDIY